MSDVPTPPAAGLDVLRLPVVGWFLKWRWSRTVVQLALLALSAVVVLHGLFGPSLAPKNLATLLAWIHYRGFLVLALLVAGNLFCLGCPFLLARDLSRRFFPAKLAWPRPLRNKWPAIVLFALILFVYERFSLWESPRWTAALALTYFASAFAVDAVFKHASFCKYVCPIGQFNFVAATASPLEVAVRDPAVCDGCRTKDCLRGRDAPPPDDAPSRHPLPVVSRGCELALFLPRKAGNMDCTFCLDCVHACPHDNIGLFARLPGDEAVADPGRAGVGRYSDRPDVGALVTLFVFGALLNAFGMVSPVYAFQAWLSRLLGTADPTAVLGTLFFLGLVVEPVLLLGVTVYLCRLLARDDATPPLKLFARRVHALVPLGFAVWVAHYAFHFLTGFLTVVPVTQYALIDLGISLFGPPRWDLGGVPDRYVYPLELGTLSLGLVGSLMVAVRQARVDHPARAAASAAPWATLIVLLFAAAVWLLSQPMEMRGTFLGG